MGNVKCTVTQIALLKLCGMQNKENVMNKGQGLVVKRELHRVEREIRKVGGKSHQNALNKCKKLSKIKFNNTKIKAKLKYR